MTLPPTFAEVRIPIQLDRERTLIFNLNTMGAFEEASKKFYFDMLLNLLESHQLVISKLGPQIVEDIRRGKQPDLRVNLLDVIRKIPVNDLRYLLWSALHEYDKDDNPSWSLTVTQVGRMIKPLDMPRILDLCLRGHTTNSPTKKELGEVGTAETKEAAPAENKVVDMPQTTHPEIGGEPSIELPEGAFA